MKSLRKFGLLVVLMAVVSFAATPADARFTRFDSPEPVITNPVPDYSAPLSPMQAIVVGLEVYHTLSLPIP